MSRPLRQRPGWSRALRKEARNFFQEAIESSTPRLATSVEVLQELMHAYLTVHRIHTLDSALRLVEAKVGEVWPIEVEDVLLARSLIDSFSGLGARDLLHVSCCRRRGVRQIKSYDRALSSALNRR